jgi:hypothetical protein
MAGTTGLEPATSDVTGRRSNQLNYVPVLRRTFSMVAQRPVTISPLVEEMKRSAFLLLLTGAPFAYAQKKKQELKEAEIEVIEPAVRREEGRITVDGKLKNTGEKPARKLTVFYEILDSDRNVLTRQKGGIDEQELEPDQETEIHAQMHFHARAVHVRLTFEDGSGRELRGINAGPFTIE